MVAIRHYAIAGLAATAAALDLTLIGSSLGGFPKALTSFVSKNTYGFSAFPNPDEKPVPGNAPIINCDSTSRQILDLQRVIIDPSTPERGQNLTITATGFLAQDIEEGAYVDVDVRYGFIRLIHQTFNLCEESKNLDIECPIEKGEQIITKEVAIPAEVPPGKYVATIRAYTKSDKLITCLIGTVEFAPN